MTKVYDYPSYILKPAIGQEEAYEIMGIKNVLESFLFADEDACIIAYGQTGNICSMTSPYRACLPALPLEWC